MPDGFDEYIRSARDLAMEGRLDESVQVFRQVLEHDPVNEDAHRGIIDILRNNEDYQQMIEEYFSWAEICQVEGLIDSAIQVYQEILALPALLQNEEMTRSGGEVSEQLEEVNEIIVSASNAIYFNLGYLYFEKGGLDEAVSCLQKSIEHNPSDSKTHTLLGQVFMQKGMDNEAIGEFQEVVRLTPDDAAYAYEMLGEIFIKNGKPPQSTIVWFRNAGDLYLKHSQPEDAIRAYERIISFEPGNKDVLARLGEIYAQQGMMEQATGIYNQLAEMYSQEGLLDKVIVLFEKLVEWNPENTGAREKIIEIYRRILEMDPSNLTARHKLIGNLLRMGDAERAVPEFIILSETYLGKGMKREAFSVCKKLLELAPNEVKAHEIIADIFYEQGKHEEAYQEYMHVINIYRERGDDDATTRVNEKMMVRFPENTELSVELAISHKNSGDFEKALSEFEKVLEEVPDSVEILEHVLDIYEQMKDYDRILEYAGKILEISPERVDLQDKILSVYEETGNRDRLLEIYEEILRNEPERTDVQDKVMALYQAVGDRDRLFGLFDSILRSKPDRLDILEKKLEIFRQEGNQAKVDEVYAEILKRRPDRVDIREEILEKLASEGKTGQMLMETRALADVYLERDDLERAEKLYERILAYNPANPAVREKMSDLYARKGNSAGAREELFILCRIYSAQEDFDSALRVCEKILELEPDDINVKKVMADLLFRQGKGVDSVAYLGDIANVYLNCRLTGQAIETISRILEFDRFNTEYRYKLIGLLKEQGRIDEALDSYRLMISIYLDEEKWDMAGVALDEAIGLQPDNLSLRRDFLNVMLEKGFNSFVEDFARTLVEMYLSRFEYDEVTGIYERLSSLHNSRNEMDKYFQIREDMAQIYERQARFADAISEYRTIVEGLLVRSDFNEAKRFFPVIVNLYFKENKPSEAVTAFEELALKLASLDKYDGSILVYEGILDVQKRLKKWDSALSTLASIIACQEKIGNQDMIVDTRRRRIEIFRQQKMNSQAVDELFNILELHLQRGDIDSAQSVFDEITDLEPDNSANIFRMAELLFDAGESDRAGELYRKLIEKEPENYTAYARLAILLARAGDLQSAVKYTREIISRGLLSEVIEEYEKRSGGNGSNGRTYINRGLFFQELGFVEQALFEFRKSLEDRDSYLTANNLIAQCLKNEGYAPLAVKQLQQPLTGQGFSEEELLDTRYGIGELYLEMDRKEEALSAFYEIYMVDINYKDVSEKIATLSPRQ